MAEYVHHEGVVLRVDGNRAQVEIVQTSACQACKARHMCLSSESKAKLIDAIMEEPVRAGEQVEVSVRERLAWRAVLVAYVLPFLVVVGAITAVSLCTNWDDAAAGGIAIASVALYYLVLSLFRNRLQRQFSFTVRKR